MFSQHVTRDLSAYCHGEVSNEESRQIAEHLIACSRCRAQYEEIKLGVKLKWMMEYCYFVVAILDAAHGAFDKNRP